MSPHLTPQQASEWILGVHSSETERHVRACPLCREELGRFEASLKGFRSSVRQWSEEQLPPFSPQLKQSPAWAMKFGWIMAAISLCLFISLLSYRNASQRRAADAALLAQIDREVSRTVPGPMEPLTQLVSWDLSSTGHSNSKPASDDQAQ